MWLLSSRQLLPYSLAAFVVHSHLQCCIYTVACTTHVPCVCLAQFVSEAVPRPRSVCAQRL